MPGILAAEHGCEGLLQAEPFVREDVQRIASGSAVGHAVVFLASPVGWVPTLDVPAVTWLPAPPRTVGTIPLRI